MEHLNHATVFGVIGLIAAVCLLALALWPEKSEVRITPLDEAKRDASLLPFLANSSAKRDARVKEQR